MAGHFLKSPELDEAVAHHVGVRGESPANTVDSIGRYALVVSLLQVHLFQPETVAARREGGHLPVLFGGTRGFSSLLAYLDIEKVGTDALFAEQVECDGTVYTARQEQSMAERQNAAPPDGRGCGWFSWVQFSCHAMGDFLWVAWFL